jgi:hypothetical protein
MEQLLLFCCRACLKGDGENNEYYEVLGIEDKKKATTDSIKAAYKKQSLLLHPDRMARRGIEVTEEHNVKFAKLKEAYDVLVDPRKRRLYDQLGSTGLMLIESPDKIDPKVLIKNFQKNRADRFKIALIVVLIFAAILALPILFSLKCDGRIDNAPWLAIWTPMWVIDAALLLSAILFLCEKEEEPEEGEERPEHVPFYLKILFLLQTSSMILIQIFVLARLDGEITWSWGKVFIPWYVYEFLGVLDKLPIAIASIPVPDYSALNVEEMAPEEIKLQKAMLGQEAFQKEMEQHISRFSIVVNLLRVWLAIFLALQLDGGYMWDWGLVLLPIWAYFALELINSYTLRRWANSLLEGINLEELQTGLNDDPEVMMKATHGQELMAAGTMGCCFQAGPLLMALLLVSRLEVSQFSTFIILIPVFLVIGCCICGVSCSLCVLTNMDMDEMGEGSDDPSAAMMAKHATYEPPHADDVESGNTPVYGTFDSSSEINKEVKVSEIKVSTQSEATQPAPSTGGDVDID